MRKRNRYISLILCLSIFLSMIVNSIPVAFAAEKSVKVMLKGQQVDNITIEQNSKEILSAAAKGMETPTFQWQILLDAENSVWVDIYDKTEVDCEISYALVKNMLDDANSTYIRCAATIDGKTEYSNEVCVTVNPEKESYAQVADFAQARYAQSCAALGTPAMLAAEQDTTSDYVTVTVKYLDIASLGGTEEAAIYSPYTAIIVRGTSFKQSVVSPTFLGFAPYFDSNGDQKLDDKDKSAATLNLDFDAVTQDIEIKVYYKPIEVDFAVKYFFQNINDDLYSEDTSRYHTDKAETGTIVTNEYLESNAGDTTGYTKMYHIPESVAADGSTVFECYYDRNYYLIQFDLDGGYGVDPIYARYGTLFIVNEPVKHGYQFVGWDRLYDTDGDGIPDTGDHRADSVNTVVGTENIMYKALWESVETTYTVAYWSENDSGEREYLGSIRVPGTSGDKVSGSDDLADQYKSIFRYEEHIHSEEAGCYGNCEFSGHQHGITCYTAQTLPLAENQQGNALTAYQNLVQKLSEPQDGNIYKYGYQPVWITTYYNFFYLNETWYYLGTGTAYKGISLNGGLSNPSNNGFTTVPANTGSDCVAMSHTHTAECLSCTKLAHIYNDECNPNPRYYVFDRADQNITVEGDGSSTVNIYYKPKKYTMRFFYARSSGSGSNIIYQVVGGSTYAFGGLGAENPADLSVEELLGRVPEGNWGKVEELPTWYTNTQLSGSTSDISQYTLGQLEAGEYTYYYFDFTSSYGENISTKWPIGILSPVKIAETHTQSNYEYAYFSAWNGENKVKYTQDNLNGNQTIKGRYMILDENLLYDGKFEDSDVVSFLGFWDNGANIGWSVPKLFRYHLMLEAPAGTVTDYEYNGKYYTLFQEFRTFDDSGVDSQTPTTISGFDFQSRTSRSVEGGYTSVTGETLQDAYEVYFWYDRNDYKLTYFNYENALNTISVPYDTLFTEEKFYKDPPYPPSLEPNAYEFVGWYTSPIRIYPIEFNKAKMPGNDIVWYAKWVPIKHTVNFFNTYDEMLDYESGDSSAVPYKTFSNVDHRTIVGNIDSPIGVGDGTLNLTFAGWFYMENGQKKAFSPLNMPISRDINIFAEWSSHSPQPYRISYVLQSNPDVHVADDATGYAYGGSTRTFNAKAGDPYNQLYSEYNNGYYPIVNSHSITIQAESDKDNLKHNVFTFYYVKAENISYTVRYVNKETNVVMETAERTTTSSVVTERFKAYPNMVPDAFYKKLVLEVEWDEEQQKYVGSENNVITFYYTSNDTSAYYAVHFMLEKLGAAAEEEANYDINGNGGYEETGTHIEGIGEIGSTVYVSSQTISGFELIDNDKVPIVYSDSSQKTAAYSDENSGYGITITQSGTELYFFYARRGISLSSTLL